MNPYAVFNITNLQSKSKLTNKSVHSIHLACSHPKWFISSLITLVKQQPVTSALSKMKIANDNDRTNQVISFWPVQVNFGAVYGSNNAIYRVSMEFQQCL
jgi:hypothetical protein